MKNYEMYINGQWCAASNNENIVSINPATEEPWATFPNATADDVDRAVSAADTAFEHGEWRKLSGTQRGQYLKNIADCVRSNPELLGQTETTDTGKLFRETRWQANNVAGFYDFFAGQADKIKGDVPITADNAPLILTMREPLGVVAAIVPWNSQLHLAAVKLGPALAAGNTIVLKPSEQASAAVLEFTRIIEKAGLPSGVINVVTGGAECGQALTSHPLVRRISFTGGVETARKIIPATRNNIARLSLELGGKSPVIVFDDANLDSVVNGVIAGIFAATGQSCAAGSRLLLHENIYDTVVEKLVERAKNIRIGDPMDDNTQMGPLATLRQRENIERILQQSVAMGAKILCGGARPKAFDKGWYFEPTIVECVDQSPTVVQEELFGPVLSVLRFKTENEALDMANTSRFAFAGGIFTRDIARAIRFARRVKAGRLWVNTYRVTSAQVPFGGSKDSGYGRESGLDAINDFTDIKSIFIDTTGEPVADPFVMR